MKPLRLGRLDMAVAAGFLAYSASAVVTPICLLLMAQELDFSLTGGGGIEAVRSLLALAALLFCGFAAARWGKVRFLGWGCLLLSAGLCCYALSPAYILALVAMSLIGIAGGILEGLLNPLVQDLHRDDSGRYLNLLNGFWSVGVMVTVLLVGELLTRGVSWRAVTGVIGVLALVPALLFLLHVPRVPHAAAPAQATWRHVRAILCHGGFWIFAAAMFFAGGAEGGLTFWSASYVQRHYAALPRAGGIGTACFAGGMIVGRFLFGHLVGQRHLYALILLSAAAGCLVSLAVPFVATLGGLYVVLAVAGITVACFWPSIQSFAAEQLETDSTMLFILLSCAGIPGFAAASWLMGWIGDLTSLKTSFLLVPLCFLLLTGTMAAFRVTHNKGGHERS